MSAVRPADSAPSDSFVARAPASTANLGPGFDSLGLAVAIYNELRVCAGSGRISVVGAGADSLPMDATNLVVQSFDRVAPGIRESLDLECTNAIPLARGLVSSTAAAACGLVAGWHAAGTSWTPEDLASELTAVDGHPDNAAPCAYGGVTVAGPSELVVGLDTPAWLSLLLVVPDRQLTTEQARNALPDSYSRAVVAGQIGAAAVLTAALARGDQEAFQRAIGLDAVHEQQRSPLIPELNVVRACIADAPAYGATISGAGPTIAVWCSPTDRDALLGLLEAAFPGLVVAPSIASSGATITPGS